MKAAHHFKTISTIADIKKDIWEEFTQSMGPLWTRQFFENMERAGVGPDVIEYHLVYRNKKLMLILPAFMFRHFPLDLSPAKWWVRFSDFFRNIWPGFCCIATCFCGHPLGQGQILKSECAEQIDVDFLMLNLRKKSKEDGYSLLILKDFIAEDDISTHIEIDKANTSIFHRVPALPDAVLNLDFKDFEEYLASMKMKARRNLRKKQRVFDADQTLEINIQQWPESLNECAFELYSQVLSKAPVKLDRLNAQFFNSLTDISDPLIKTITVMQQGKPIAFVVFVSRDDIAYCLRVGVDYPSVATNMAYFVMHYEAIRLAIESGCKELNFCQSTYQFKQEVGCHIEQRDYIFNHSNKFVNKIAPGLLSAMFSLYRKQAGLMS